MVVSIGISFRCIYEGLAGQSVLTKIGGEGKIYLKFLPCLKVVA